MFQTSRCHLIAELVADAKDREDITRFPWVDLQFLAQVLNMRIDAAGITAGEYARDGNVALAAGLYDKPVAGLLKDLKRRGLLKDTLVVWGTEFGRSPGAQGDGRDHHPQGFCAWLAGGGIKGGVVNGATDEIGFHAVEQRHYVTDIHATVLHQLGIDAHKLEVPGRKRLDIDYGKPIKDIIG